MRIGVPRECKPREGRVALCPAAVRDLVAGGHELLVQGGAGLASGLADDDYRQAGADVVADASSLYGGAELIVKVKEPVRADLDLLEARHWLFSYLHLAAEPALVERLRAIGLTACAFETVVQDGRLPLLAPMSAVAGRIAVQAGAHYLQAHNGGRGILPGGVPGAPAAVVVVLGCGVAGSHAIEVALGLGAEVVALDIAPAVRQRIAGRFPAAQVEDADPASLQHWIPRADLLIGAALVPGARAPVIVGEKLVKQMQPGAVIVDIAVDQGGCVETTRPTTYEDPVYRMHGVIHMAVTNLPGAVPRTASQALSAAILPFVQQLAASGPDALPGAVNVRAGQIEHPAVRAAMEELNKKDTIKG